MPASGPGCGATALIDSATAAEGRFLLREERRIAAAEILGIEAVEAFVELGLGQRLGAFQPAREFLVPARNQRRAVGDALRGRARFGGHVRIGHDTRDQPFLPCLRGIEDAAFEQDL